MFSPEMMPATHGYTMQAVEALPVSPRTSATPVRPYAFRAPNLVQVQAMSLQQVSAYPLGNQSGRCNVPASSHPCSQDSR